MATTALPETAPFPFFDLPPELRDWALNCITTDELTIAAPASEAHLAIKDYPLLNILLANRQLKEEYYKRAAMSTTLIISDHEEFNFLLLPIPARLVGVSNLQVRMFVVCESACPDQKARCEAVSDLEQTTDLISKLLLQLPNVRSLDVHLGLWVRPSCTFTWPDTPHDSALVPLVEKLTEIPQMSKLCLYRADERCLDASNIVDGRAPFASWQKTPGWVCVETVSKDEIGHTVVPKT